MSRAHDKTNPWTLVGRADKFDCSYFTACSDTVSHKDGNPRSYNYVRMKYLGVGVVPIDVDGSTTLIGQYRYVLNTFTWELPRGAGALNVPAIESAKSELSEETGYRADHWLHLFDATASPGTTSEIAVGYVAWGLHPGEPHMGEEECLTQRRVSFQQAVTMALTGEIVDLASITLLLSVQTKLFRGELPADLAKLLT